MNLTSIKNILPNRKKLYAKLGALEAHSISDTLAKEVFGINIPKILCTRTTNERTDVAISEVGNTLAFTAGGLLLNKVLDISFAQAKKRAKQPIASHWEQVGRSTALYSAIFSMMWAMPFVRNYITAKRTGHSDFSSFIVKQPQVSPNSLAQADLQTSLHTYKKKAESILGLGACGSFLSVLVSIVGIKSGWGEKRLEKLVESSSFYTFFSKRHWVSEEPKNVWQKGLKNLMSIRFKDLLLREGQFSNFSGLPALLFWGVPAYGGWIHASRDSYEKKEQLLKFASFTACFFILPVIMNKVLGKAFKKRFPEVSSINYQAIQKAFSNKPEALDAALFLWAAKNAVSLGSSIFLLGIIPQLINIKLTEKRMKRVQEEQITTIPSTSAQASPFISEPKYTSPYPMYQG